MCCTLQLDPRSCYGKVCVSQEWLRPRVLFATSLSTFCNSNVARSECIEIDPVGKVREYDMVSFWESCLGTGLCIQAMDHRGVRETRSEVVLRLCAMHAL